MGRVQHLLAVRMRVYGLYVRSLVLGGLFRSRYRSVRSFCLFVGYPRSGHSLIGALLNAHPNCMIAMEWGMFFYLRFGFKRWQILYSLVRNARQFTRKYEDTWTGYSYRVPGSSQGTYHQLQVVGDKFGGYTTMTLLQNSQPLHQLARRLKLPVFLVHVTRNPFDVISTTCLRNRAAHLQGTPVGYLELLPYIDTFFRKAGIVRRLKQEGTYSMIDIDHERFIDNPRAELTRLLHFLELDLPDGYLNRCASIVYDEPNKSRHRVGWSPALIRMVEEELSHYDFLQHYRFSS